MGAQPSTALTEDEVAATMQEFKTVYFDLQSLNSSLLATFAKIQDLQARSRRCAERCPEYAVEWFLSLKSETRKEKEMDEWKWLENVAATEHLWDCLGFSQDAVISAIERIKKRSGR